MINHKKLKISATLKDFVNSELLPGLDITEDYFWDSFEDIIHQFSDRNRALLEKREFIQKQIDEWHLKNKGLSFSFEDYKVLIRNWLY